METNPQPPTEPTRQEKTNVLKIGIVELGIIVVIILAVLTVLNYFRVITLASWLPQKEAPIQTTTGPTEVATNQAATPDAAASLSISSYSEMPGIEFRIVNAPAFIEFLSQLGVINTNQSDLRHPQSVVVYLTNWEQPVVLSEANGQPTLTYNMFQEGKAARIYLYIPDEQLENSEAASNLAMEGLIKALYINSHPAESDEIQARDQQIEDILEQLANENQTHVQIIKANGN